MVGAVPKVYSRLRRQIAVRLPLQPSVSKSVLSGRQQFGKLPDRLIHMPRATRRAQPATEILPPESLDVEVLGPFSWMPSDSSDAPCLFTAPAGRLSGVYLWTAPRPDGYLVYCVGYTTRPFVQRFRSHTREFLAGTYNVLDAAELLAGRRKQVWHGLWFKKESLHRLEEFFSRSAEITAHTRELLRTFRVFFIPVDAPRRVLARMEAALMNQLYAGPAEISSIPDRGMQLSSRWRDETPIPVKLRGPVFLGFPPSFDI